VDGAKQLSPGRWKVVRQRWAVWFILIAFFAGLLRVPAAALVLTGYVSTGDPT
jgi:hypothetical protein